MKNLILLSVLFISGFLYSQTDTTKSILTLEQPYFYKNSVGFEIRQFSKKQKTAILLKTVGTGIIFLGGINNESPLMAIGGAITLLGFGIHISSYTHLDNASILLNQRGVGLAIKLGNK
jgi:hypothetical protein